MRPRLISAPVTWRDLPGKAMPNGSQLWMKTVATWCHPTGSVGYRWDGSARWNMEEREGVEGHEVKLQLSLIKARMQRRLGGLSHFLLNEAPGSRGTIGESVQYRNVPVPGDRPGDGSRTRRPCTI